MHELRPMSVKTFSSGCTFLSGCLKKIWINDRLVDFSSITTQYKVVPGCPRHEKANPCEEHMCKFGKCRPLEGMSYECECRRGYSGAMCDLGVYTVYSI